METYRILEEAVAEASSILEGHRLALDSLADLLCEQETVDGAQIDAILDQKEKQEKGGVFPRPAPNGHKSSQMVALMKDDGWSIGKVEQDGLLRWEDEGGQIANRVDEREASTPQGYSILLERSPENASL